MTVISNLTVVLGGNTSEFDNAMKSSAQRSREWNQAARAAFQGTRTEQEKFSIASKRLQELAGNGRISMDTYNRGISQLQQEYAAASRSSSGLSSAIGSVGGSVLGFSTGVGAAVVAANAFTGAMRALAGATVDAAAHGVKLAAEYESTQVAFKTMLGSAQTARKVLDELSTFAAQTPFEFPELADASRKLVAFGVSADNLLPTLRSLGDISSGISQPIGEIAEIYGKARTQGRLFAEDINQFTGRGIPIIAELAKQFRVNQNEVRKLVETGQVGFKNLAKAFDSMTSDGGRFQGMMDAQSQTMKGLMSTLRDNFNLSLRDMGTAISRELNFKEAIQSAIEFSSTIKTKWVPEIVDGIGFAKELALSLHELDGMVFGPLAQAEAFVGAMGTARAKLLEFQRLYANLTGNTVLADTISGMLRERANPRPKQQPKVRANTDAEGDAGAEALAQAIAKLNAELEKDVATMRLSVNETKLWELVQRGATEAQLEQARAAMQSIEVAEQAHARWKKFDDEQREFIETLQREIATFGMTADAAKRWALEQQADETGLDHMIDSLLRQKQALEDAAAATRKAKDEIKALADEGKRLHESLETPAERYEREMGRIKEMLKQSAITQEDFDRAKARLDKEAADSKRSNSRDASNPALVRGSAEEFAAIMRANSATNDRDGVKNIAKEQLNVQREQLNIMRNSGRGRIPNAPGRDERGLIPRPQRRGARNRLHGLFTDDTVRRSTGAVTQQADKSTSAEKQVAATQKQSLDIQRRQEINEKSMLSALQNFQVWKS